MRADEKLTIYEGASLLTMTFLYHIFNEVLAVLVSTSGTSAWISQVISCVLSLAYLGLFLVLTRQYKGLDMLGIFDAVYGRHLSKVFLTVLLAFLFLYAAVSLNQAVELLQIYAYSEISALEIDLLMMAAVGVIAMYSIKGLGKTVSIFLPFIFATVLLILAMSHKQYDINLLNPLWGFGVKNTVMSGVMLTSQFNGILVLSVFFTSFGGSKEFKRCGLWAIAASSFLIAVTTVCYNMAVPYNCAKDLMVGVLGIAQNNYTSRFFQRMESVFISITVISIVMLLGISFLAIKKIYCHLFSINKKHSSAVIIPLALVVVCMGRTMGNLLFFKNLARTGVRRYGIVPMMALLLLTLLVGWVRRWLSGGSGQKLVKAGCILMVPLLCMGFFSGCAHYREPDTEIYPIIMGYDKGETEKYRITMKFMLETSSTEAGMEESEDSGDSIPKDLIVVEAPTFTEGINLINSIIPKKVSMLHIKMLVVSEEIAREGVDGFVAPLIRYNEIKPTMAFVVCRNSAFDFINSERSTLTDSLQMDMELILETSKDSTSYFVVSIAELLYNYKSTYGDAVSMYGAINASKYLPEPREGESPAEHIKDAPSDFSEGFLPGGMPVTGNSKMELAGMAVFRGDKMVGALDTQECEVLMFLNNKLDSASFSLPDLYDPEKYYVSMQVRKVRPTNIKTWIDQDGIAHIDIKAYLNANVGVAQNPRTSYTNDATEREALSEYLADSLEVRTQELMEKLQKQYQADVLQLGRHVAKNFATIQEWEAYGWKDAFRNAEINVSFQFNL